MARSPDVVVVGAGAIGCAIANALASQGARVTVLERSRVAAESSGAAAGILAPRVHATAPSMFDLALASHRLFGPLVEDLRARAGLDSEYVRSGVVDLALDEDDEERLRDKVRWLRESGHSTVEWLPPDAVLAREPHLNPRVRGAFSDADAYHIHPARFTRALSQGAALRGVRLELGVEVTGLERHGPSATGVRTATGVVPAGHVVIAAGAWSSFCGDWIGRSVPVFPVRGQILTLHAVPSPIRSIVFGADAYLFPRVDGSIVVGATIEQVGYDRSLTAGGVSWLLNSIPTLCPALADARFDRAWTGLRPGSPDDLPIVGAAPGWENVTLATGHYRNGIMLAPITAQLVAALVLKGESHTLLKPLDPARFG